MYEQTQSHMVVGSCGVIAVGADLYRLHRRGGARRRHGNRNQGRRAEL